MRKCYLEMFLGYASYAGRIGIGDVSFADSEELEKLDASEIHAGRLKCKGTNYAEEW